MNLENVIQGVRSAAFFNDLSSEETRALFQNAEYKDLRNHEDLFIAGEPASAFAVIVHGALKLVRPNGRTEKTVMYFAVPGEVVGALFMAQENVSYSVSAIAMGPTAVLLMPKSTFQTVWSEKPAIQAKLNALFYTRMQFVQDQRAQVKMQLQARIGAILLNLLARQPSKESVFLPILLTRQEIADSVGASVEAVIRCMSEMSAAGIIKTENKIIEVLRADLLIQMSCGYPTDSI